MQSDADASVFNLAHPDVGLPRSSQDYFLKLTADLMEATSSLDILGLDFLSNDQTRSAWSLLALGLAEDLITRLGRNDSNSIAALVEIQKQLIRFRSILESATPVASPAMFTTIDWSITSDEVGIFEGLSLHLRRFKEFMRSALGSAQTVFDAVILRYAVSYLLQSWVALLHRVQGSLASTLPKSLPAFLECFLSAWSTALAKERENLESLISRSNSSDEMAKLDILTLIDSYDKLLTVFSFEATADLWSANSSVDAFHFVSFQDSALSAFIVHVNDVTERTLIRKNSDVSPSKLYFLLRSCPADLRILMHNFLLSNIKSISRLIDQTLPQESLNPGALTECMKSILGVSFPKGVVHPCHPHCSTFFDRANNDLCVPEVLVNYVSVTLDGLVSALQKFKVGACNLKYLTMTCANLAVHFRLIARFKCGDRFAELFRRIMFAVDSAKSLLLSNSKATDVLESLRCIVFRTWLFSRSFSRPRGTESEEVRVLLPLWIHSTAFYGIGACCPLPETSSLLDLVVKKDTVKAASEFVTLETLVKVNIVKWSGVLWSTVGIMCLKGIGNDNFLQSRLMRVACREIGSFVKEMFAMDSVDENSVPVEKFTTNLRSARASMLDVLRICTYSKPDLLKELQQPLPNLLAFVEVPPERKLALDEVVNVLTCCNTMSPVWRLVPLHRLVLCELMLPSQANDKTKVEGSAISNGAGEFACSAVRMIFSNYSKAVESIWSQTVTLDASIRTEWYWVAVVAAWVSALRGMYLAQDADKWSADVPTFGLREFTNLPRFDSGETQQTVYGLLLVDALCNTLHALRMSAVASYKLLKRVDGVSVQEVEFLLRRVQANKVFLIGGGSVGPRHRVKGEMGTKILSLMKTVRPVLDAWVALILTLGGKLAKSDDRRNNSLDCWVAFQKFQDLLSSAFVNFEPRSVQCFNPFCFAEPSEPLENVPSGQHLTTDLHASTDDLFAKPLPSESPDCEVISIGDEPEPASASPVPEPEPQGKKDSGFATATPSEQQCATAAINSAASSIAIPSPCQIRVIDLQRERMRKKEEPSKKKKKEPSRLAVIADLSEEPSALAVIAADTPKLRFTPYHVTRRREGCSRWSASKLPGAKVETQKADINTLLMVKWKLAEQECVLQEVYGPDVECLSNFFGQPESELELIQNIEVFLSTAAAVNLQEESQAFAKNRAKAAALRREAELLLNRFKSQKLERQQLNLEHAAQSQTCEILRQLTEYGCSFVKPELSKKSFEELTVEFQQHAEVLKTKLATLHSATGQFVREMAPIIDRLSPGDDSGKSPDSLASVAEKLRALAEAHVARKAELAEISAKIPILEAALKVKEETIDQIEDDLMPN